MANREGALWLALSEQGVSTHMLWLFHTLYFGQHGEVTGQRGSSRTFQINAGVRQGCVLSPKMFSADFCSTSLSNVKVANMGGRMFVWIWSWWWPATTFGLKICGWYLDIRKIFPGDNDVVGQTGSILGWCRPEIECRKNCVDHNRGSTTTVLDYLHWSRDQGKGKGIRSQMVGLHVIFNRFKKWSSEYWLSFAICKSRFLCQQIDISEPKCVHQKQTETFRCHRDTNCLFWSWAPVHPCCRYG